MKRRLWQVWNYISRFLGNCPPLLSVAFQITNVCNLNCLYCNRDRTAKPLYIEQDFFQSVLDQLDILPYKLRLGLNYDGESLLHPQFTQMLEYAIDKKHFLIRFHTNGTLLGELNGLDLSSVQVVLSDHNINIPKENLDFCKTVNIVDVSSDVQPHQVDKWLSHFDTITVTPLVEKLNTNMEYGNHPQRYCFYPFTTLYVMANGDVKLCCHIQADTTVGNIRRMNILDFWKSNRMQELRRYTKLNHVPPLEACQQCRMWRFMNYSRKITRKQL